MKKIKENIFGVILCEGIAAAATFLSGFKIGTFSMDIIGAPVFAILLGMIISLIAPEGAVSESLKFGIKFTSKKILQYAVIILGFSLNLSTILSVGTKSLPVILSTIATSLIVAFIMMKILKMDGKVSTLIGVGSSICGGSAIAATAPVIDADDEEIAQSISVIFLFNVLAALIFPTFGHMIGLGSEGFAIFAGTAVNDTSSVTACASTADGIYGTAQNAVTILSEATAVKLTRTLAIIPITLVLSVYYNVKAKKNGGKESSFSFKKIFPFFILYFVAAAVITTIMGIIPESAVTVFYFGTFVKAMKWLAKFFIAMAMAAIGLNTNIVELVKKGGKPILMGLCCWASITAVSIAVQLLTGVFFTNL